MTQDFPSSLTGLEAHLLTLNLPADERTEVLADVRDKLERAHPDAVALSERARLDFARRLQAFHHRVNGLIGGRIFRDPSWPMLLELFIGSQERRNIGVSDLSRGLNISPTTGLRHVERMEEEGLARRRDDPADARRTFVEPTAKAIQGVSRVLDDMRTVF